MSTAQAVTCVVVLAVLGSVAVAVGGVLAGKVLAGGAVLALVAAIALWARRAVSGR